MKHMSSKTGAERYEEIKEQWRKANHKYYEKNKVKILEGRRLKRIREQEKEV